jgi:hypothetical protein
MRYLRAIFRALVPGQPQHLIAHSKPIALESSAHKSRRVIAVAAEKRIALAPHGNSAPVLAGAVAQAGVVCEIGQDGIDPLAVEKSVHCLSLSCLRFRCVQYSTSVYGNQPLKACRIAAILNSLKSSTVEHMCGKRLYANVGHENSRAVPLWHSPGYRQS